MHPTYSLNVIKPASPGPDVVEENLKSLEFIDSPTEEITGFRFHAKVVSLYLRDKAFLCLRILLDAIEFGIPSSKPTAIGKRLWETIEWPVQDTRVTILLVPFT